MWFRDTLIVAAAALVVDDDGYDDVDLVNQFVFVFISRYRGSASIMLQCLTFRTNPLTCMESSLPKKKHII